MEIHHGESPQSFVKHEYIIHKDGRALQIAAHFDQNGKQLIPPSNGGNELMVTLSAEELAGSGGTVNDPRRLRASLQESSVAIWVVGKSPLMEYFRQAKIAQNLTSAGATLNAKSELGEIAVNLSEKHGWLPRSFVVTKSAESRIGNHVVRSLYSTPVVPEDENAIPVIGEGAASKTEASVQLKKMIWSGDVTLFAQATNGIWFPSQISLSKQVHFASGKTTKSHCEISVQAISDEVVGECDEPSVSIPIGYPVSIDGAIHLPYRWNGSKAIPGVPTMEARSERAFITNVFSGGALVLLLNLVALAVILGVWVYKRKAIRN